MSKKPNSKNTETDHETFERLPEKKKEMMKLKEEDEKTTDSEPMEAAKKIEDNTQQENP